MTSSLRDVAAVFLRLGILGFGGPAAHIALMKQEVVDKRQWLTESEFIDLVGATNLIPGPNSTEMAMHVGLHQAGLRGLIVAGLCFIVPAVIITGTIAWLYEQWGTLPEVMPFVYGIRPALLAVILSVMWSFGRTTIKNKSLVVIALSAIALIIAGLPEIAVLFICGALGVSWALVSQQRTRLNVAEPLTVAGIFWLFLKVGSVLYGSGYVLFAVLGGELVTTGYLDHRTLSDAIAVGQFTPGPVFSSATFLGWQLGGIQGAIAATIGIFLPSFVFVAALNPLVRRLRTSPIMSAFLDAVNVASVVLILYVCYLIGIDALVDWRTTIIAIASLAALLYFRNLNSALLILFGAIAGYLLY